ncbi:MmpS family transport accessory protein [Nocardia sp. CA-135398]|uniref:MmpS family transport accessory protein n=1 Tax=Nocardia sp. CA-135398 TaxID=3239977 RepID=UPI003D97F39D
MSNQQPPNPPQDPGQQPPQRHPQGQPPGGYQQPYQGAVPPPAYCQQPAKKKKWPWILGGLVLVFVLSIGGCLAFLANIATDIDKESTKEVTVKYEVTSDGPIAGNITYSSGGDAGQIAQANEQPLPWSRDVTVTGFVKAVSLSAQADEGATKITCRITEGGKVIAEQTSTGPFAIASCSGEAGK